MKRIVAAMVIVLALFVFVFTAQAQQAKGTGAFTSSQVVVARAALLGDIGIQTDGTADVTVLLYDNATTYTGRVIAFAFCPSGSKVAGWTSSFPILAVNGIYAAVSGTGITRIIVTYVEQ